MESNVTDAFGLTGNDLEQFQLFIDANEAYYNLNNETDDSEDFDDDEPIMSDGQFDQIVEYLKSLGNQRLTDYITRRIWTNDRGMVEGSEVSSQMVSLYKVQYENRSSVTEIFRFLVERENLWYSPKMDGNAIKTFLEKPVDGVYPVRQIITRGGLDVTSTLKGHPSFVFTTEEYDIPTLMIHGELLLPKKVFLENWSEESEIPIKIYANPRNAVRGVLKNKPSDLIYIPCTDGINPLHNKVRGSIWKKFTAERTIYNIIDYNAEWKSEAFPYPIDGMAIAVEAERQEIKENYVKNIVAIKFPAPKAQTVVTDIVYTQKKSGTLTPVIRFDPTLLDGSTVKKANGFNYNNIRKLQIGIGSVIIITKSNDIIPVVDKVLKKSSNIPMPDVDYIFRGKHLFAVDMTKSTMYKFNLALKLMQVDGIGETFADQIGSIVEYDIIRLFNHENKPAIRQILGGGKTWNKFEAFYNTKQITLDLLINLLQFDGCGPILSRIFANAIMGKKPSMSGVDKSVMNIVCTGDGFARIQKSIADLRAVGIKVIAPIQINDDSITFEMSGNPPEMTKAEFTEKIKGMYPNSVHTTLTKDTKYLIVDSLQSTSSKLNKARKYNTKMITYETALKGSL